MRILITGASGFIGGALARRFAADGCEVVALYRRRPPDLGAATKRVTLVAADLSRPLPDTGAVDLVIHAAAHTHLIANSTARDYASANVVGALSLLDQLRRRPPRLLVHLSTVSVYGRVAVPVLTEETPLGAPDLYGATKYAAELVLREAADVTPVVTARLPGVVGPGYFTPWLGQLVQKSTRNEPLTLWNPETLFNNVVDLDELHRFITHVAAAPPPGATTVNQAAEQPVSVRALAALVRELTGSASEVTERTGERPGFSISTERLRASTGFAPAATREIVTRYVTGQTSGERAAAVLRSA